MRTPLYRGTFKTVPLKRPLPGVAADVMHHIYTNNGFVAGGAAAFVCAEDEPHQKPNDIDVFFGDAEGYFAFGTYMHWRQDYTHEYTDRTLIFKPYVETGEQMPDERSTIQCIVPLAGSTQGTPEEVLQLFDFTVAQAAMQIVNGRMMGVVSDDFMGDFDAGTLRMTCLDDPFRVLSRVQKYVRKGFHMPLSEIAILFDDVRRRDEGYWETVQKRIVDLGADSVAWIDWIDEPGANLPKRPPLLGGPREDVTPATRAAYFDSDDNDLPF